MTRACKLLRSCDGSSVKKVRPCILRPGVAMHFPLNTPRVPAPGITTVYDVLSGLCFLFTTDVTIPQVAQRLSACLGRRCVTAPAERPVR